MNIYHDIKDIARRGIKYYSFYIGSFTYDKWTKIISREKLEKRQLKKLQGIINHAYDYVPFYQERFNSIGLHPLDIKSFDDFRKIPILTRNDVRSNFPDKIASKKWKVKKNNVFHSSGSTGESVYFIKSKDWKISCLMGVLRMQHWSNSNVASLTTPYCSGNTCSVTEVPESLEDKLRRLLIRTHINPYILLPSSHNIIMEQDDYFYKLVDLIALYKPKYFYADPVYIAAFAYFLKKNNIKVSGIKGVTTTSELLLKAHKEVIEEVFGCDVYTQYGCSELRDIANECELKKLHIRMDAVYAEGIWNNKQILSGQLGRLIITHLDNYKMPLIRYEVGDTVRWSDQNCACGRNTRIIENIEGKNTDLLLASDNDIVTPRDVDNILSQVDFIDYYQVIQNDYNNLDIFYISNNGRFNQKSLPGDVKEKIDKLFKTRININFRQVREILPRKSKKYRFVYSKLNIPNIVSDLN